MGSCREKQMKMQHCCTPNNVCITFTVHNNKTLNSFVSLNSLKSIFNFRLKQYTITAGGNSFRGKHVSAINNSKPRQILIQMYNNVHNSKKVFTLHFISVLLHQLISCIFCNEISDCQSVSDCGYL